MKWSCENSTVDVASFWIEKTGQSILHGSEGNYITVTDRAGQGASKKGHTSPPSTTSTTNKSVRNDSSSRAHLGTNCSAEETEQTNRGSNIFWDWEWLGGAEACVPIHLFQNTMQDWVLIGYFKRCCFLKSSYNCFWLLYVDLSVVVKWWFFFRTQIQYINHAVTQCIARCMLDATILLHSKNAIQLKNLESVRYVFLCSYIFNTFGYKGLIQLVQAFCFWNTHIL